MRVVVVGAGAVGQVYARHLRAGGAEVAFRVRRPGATRRPFVIHSLNGRRETSRFDVPVFGTDDEVRAFRPDVALITVPSDKMRDPWLAPFLEACGDALIVSLQPGVDELTRIREARPGVRVAMGIIAFIAYQTPLPGEDGRFSEPGIAVWLPPSACPFAGPDVAPFADLLAKGGLRTVVRGDLTRTTAFGSLTMATYITALKSVGWSFAALRGSDALDVAWRANDEAAAVSERRLGTTRPAIGRLATPAVIRAVLWLGARVLPLDLETYLNVHFTKVGAQTRMHLQTAEEHGRALSLPVRALQTLLDRTAAPAEPSVAGTPSSV